MQPSPAQIEEYSRLATEALEESNRDLHRILLYAEDPQDKADPQKLAVACMCAAIIQSARDCMILLEKRSGSTVACLLRSIVESYVDLCAAIIDGKYIERMMATFYSEKERMLKSFGRGEDVLFDADTLDPTVELKKVSAELAAIEARGQKHLKVDERFDCGERWGIYDWIYWQLCLRSQNNIVALENRHLKRVADDLQVLMVEESELSELAIYYDALTWLLVDSAIRVHGFLMTGLVTGYENQLRALLTFRCSVLEKGARPPSSTGS
jgi:hypothetical protein